MQSLQDRSKQQLIYQLSEREQRMVYSDRQRDCVCACLRGQKQLLVEEPTYEVGELSCLSPFGRVIEDLSPLLQ